MWTYAQATGSLSHDDVSVGTGYSGFEQGKNNPAFQEVPDVGPLPCGTYAIGPPFTHPTKGPLVMTLTPEPDCNEFGRSGFLIHGDSIAHPGEASEGCIIMAHDIRLQISTSGDNQLTVISGLDLG